MIGFIFSLAFTIVVIAVIFTVLGWFGITALLVIGFAGLIDTFVHTSTFDPAFFIIGFVGLCFASVVLR